MQKNEMPKGPAMQTEEKSREQMIYELQYLQMDDEDMVSHIWYCIDHKVPEAAEQIMKIARSRRRKWTVREAAVEYVCRMLPVSTICKQVLPSLGGRKMIDVVERFLDTEDEQLIDFVWNYGERFGEQKIACDALVIELQGRCGLASLRNHMEKRKGVPRDKVYPDPVHAVAAIHRAELLDELERILLLVMKDDFKDRKTDGLRQNLGKAFRNVAVHGGADAKERVLTLLRTCFGKYAEGSWQSELIMQWISEIAA